MGAYLHILSQYFINLCKIKWFPCNKIWYFADALWIYFFGKLLFYVYFIPPFSKIEKLMLLKLHFLNKVRIKIRWYAEHMINFKKLKWLQNKNKQEWEPAHCAPHPCTQATFKSPAPLGLNRSVFLQLWFDHASKCTLWVVTDL